MNQKLKDLLIAEHKKNTKSKKFIPGKSLVPISGKVFDKNEIIAMTQAVLDGWWTDGEINHQFEQQLAKFIGVKYCATVNSGSSANLVAVSALTSHLLGKKRLKTGDEVITVAAAFPTTVNPIIQNGCVPVFVDVELKTLNIDITKLEKALSKKTKAIMFAHTLGNPSNLDKIKKFCTKHNLWFIEDNCDAFGSEYNGQKTGSSGHISTVSFYPAHHITTAEGGAIFTQHALLNKAIRSVRDWGRDCWCPTGRDNTCKNRYNWQRGNLPKGYDHKYTYSHIGYNLKMTDIHAACGLVQLKKVKQFAIKRKQNYQALKEALSEFDKYFLFVEEAENASTSWFGFPLILKEDAPFSRKELLEFLNERRIATRLLFAGNVTKQPYFLSYDIPHRVVGKLSNTDMIMNNTLWLGVYPGITKEMITWVKQSFNDFLSRYEKKLPTILISGASGFIGSFLTAKLVKEKYPVIILKRSFSNTKRIEAVLKKVKIYNIDKQKLETVFKNNQIDVVVNLAVDHGKSENTSSTNLFETNVSFPLQLIELANQYKVKYYFSIDTLLDPQTNAYADSKSVLRTRLSKLKNLNLKIFNLRLAYVYGENNNLYQFLPYAVKKLRTNQTLKMTSGEQEIDFLNVKDVVRAILYLLDNRNKYKKKFEEFEIGTGKTIKLKKIIKLLKEKLQSKSIIEYGAIPYRKNEQMKLVADPSSLKAWKAKYAIEKYLASLPQKKQGEWRSQRGYPGV